MSPDGSWIVSASDDHTLKVWDVASGAGVAQLPLAGQVTCVAIGPGGAPIACGDSGGSVYLVEVVGLELGPIARTHRLPVRVPRRDARQGPRRPLMADLKDGDEQGREAAAVGLGEFEDDQTIEQLGAILKEGNREECDAALGALFEVRSAHAVRMIFASYDHLASTCGGTLGMVLGMLNELVVETAIDVLDDDSEEVRSGAVASLRLLIGSVSSVRAHMKTVLKSLDPDKRRAAQQALRRYHIDG